MEDCEAEGARKGGSARVVTGTGGRVEARQGKARHTHEGVGEIDSARGACLSEAILVVMG